VAQSGADFHDGFAALRSCQKGDLVNRRLVYQKVLA
jgi:hypothetical protein